jgi:hypothetical protein
MLPPEGWRLEAELCSPEQDQLSLESTQFTTGETPYHWARPS